MKTKNLSIKSNNKMETNENNVGENINPPIEENPSLDISSTENKVEDIKQESEQDNKGIKVYHDLNREVNTNDFDTSNLSDDYKKAIDTAKGNETMNEILLHGKQLVISFNGDEKIFSNEKALELLA